MKRPANMESGNLDIVVIGLNEERFLGGCLESVLIASQRLTQKTGLSCQIYYVDSHSTDRSVEIARDLGVMVLMAPSGFRTPSNGRMTGFLLSKGEYVLFLDGDMELQPDFLPEALDFLSEHPQAAGVRGVRDDLQYRGSQPILIRNFDKVPEAPTSENAYFGGAFLARRTALEQVGGFEVCLPNNEEVALYFKLRQAGWLTYRIPLPMITHLNDKISNPARVVSRLLWGRKPMMTGVLLRYAVMRTGWWQGLLHYQLPQFIHVLFLAVLLMLLVSCLITETRHVEFLLSAAFSLVAYAGYLVYDKRSFTRGIAALFLRTIYAFNLMAGFLFFHPRMQFGFQQTEEYFRLVSGENPGAGQSGK